MPAKINLLNQTFGKLKVIEETNKRKYNSVVWKCQCECGEIEEFSTKELRSEGFIQCHKCGHNRNPNTHLTENIIGKIFNHLTVLEKTNNKSGGKILYKCQCDCDKHTIVYVNRTDLISGHTKSCGCIRRKFNINDTINHRKILSIKNSNSRRETIYQCKCLFCNRIYDTTAQTLQHTISCGCQKSIGEYNIISILNKNNISYKKEYCIDNFRFDFALINNDKIYRLIEFDGEQHYNDKQGLWGKSKETDSLEKIKERDEIKNKWAKENNIPLVRIPYWERDKITLEIILGDKYLI